MRIVALALAVVGIAAMTYGIALLYAAAAWIFAGACVASYGLLMVDVGPKPEKQAKS